MHYQCDYIPGRNYCHPCKHACLQVKLSCTKLKLYSKISHENHQMLKPGHSSKCDHYYQPIMMDTGNWTYMHWYAAEVYNSCFALHRKKSGIQKIGNNANDNCNIRTYKTLQFQLWNFLDWYYTDIQLITSSEWLWYIIYISISIMRQPFPEHKVHNFPTPYSKSLS